MKKLYIVTPGHDGEGLYQLVAETGEGLAGHYCSDRSFAKGDLIANRPNRIKEYTKKFGTFKVLFLGEDDLTLEELVERNKQFNEANEQEGETNGV